MDEWSWSAGMPGREPEPEPEPEPEGWCANVAGWVAGLINEGVPLARRGSIIHAPPGTTGAEPRQTASPPG